MADALQITSTRCHVTIQPPGNTQPDWTPDEMVMDLRHVHTHNDLAEACGTFTLTLAPRAGQRRTADAAIPLGSLVTIAFFDPQSPQRDEQAAVVMVGRTERHQVTLDYSQRQVRRQITLSGRSVASALLTTTWYHSKFEQDPQSGTLRFETQVKNLYMESILAEPHQDPRVSLTQILHYLLGLPSRTPTITTTQTGPAPPVALSRGVPVPPVTPQGPTTRRYAARDAIAQLRAQDPTLTLVEAEMLVFRQQMAAELATDAGHDLPGVKRRRPAVPPRPVPPRVQAQPPVAVPTPVPAPAAAAPVGDPGAGKTLVNWQIPGVTVADVLVLKNDQWTVFEEGVLVPSIVQMGQQGSVWNLCHTFIDPLFQEFFTRIEDGVCAIHFRGKPFQQKEVTKGTRFLSESETLHTLATLPCGPGVLLHADFDRNVGQVYNIFRVMPLGAQPLLSEPSVIYNIIPTILEDHDHPSNVLRWGPHPLDHKSPYLAGTQTLPNTVSAERDNVVLEHAKHWGEIAAWWYGWKPELAVGTLVLRGSPRWNIGHRLLYDDGGGDPWEAYTEGVDHLYVYDPASQSGRYTTQLRVTRIWPLSGAVDHRGSVEVEVLTPEAMPGPTETELSDQEGGS